MKLSKNFPLKEFEHSTIAIRHDIDNRMPTDLLPNAIYLCESTLQPARDHFGIIDISSGYRSLPLNRLLRSSDTSDHRKGCAADIEAQDKDVSNMDLAVWLRDNTSFNQLILEFFTPGDSKSGWVHVSRFIDDNKNKNEVMTAFRIPDPERPRKFKNAYLPGLLLEIP